MATDADTLDSLLTYEIKYSTSTEWASLPGNATGTVKSVNPGDSFSISVRALDDFGNYSLSTTPVDWSYPETVFYVSQTETNSFSNSFGYYSSDMLVQPIIFQSFTPESDFSFDKAVLKIKHETGTDSANIRLSVYPDNGSNQPDFANQLGLAVLGLSFSDGTQDSTFNFSSPVPVAASSTYWLVLDTQSYGGGNTFNIWSRNAWKAAVSSADPYNGGLSGGADKQGGNYGSFYYSGGADWYMKLGLE